MEGIEVRLRYFDDAQGKALCRVGFDQLDALIAEMKRWRVNPPEGDPTANLAGQSVLDGEAYFEIIIGEE